MPQAPGPVFLGAPPCWFCRICDQLALISESAAIVETDTLDGRAVEMIASEIGGASLRTFERIFAEETGLSLATWRRHSRLLTSLSLLAEGKSVGEIAHAVGYDSPAAFSTAFKQCFGVSPSSYG